jgi:ribosomal-protein-alanine N-acetyltransferase
MSAPQHLQIVAAHDAHPDVLAALHGRCFEDAWTAEAVAGVLKVPGTFGLIACQADDPVGFILFRTVGGEGEVLGLGVTPARRRSGIGGRLLSEALVRAEALGALRMTLEVAIDNNAARRLYSSAGFVTVGHRRSYYSRSQGPRTDALILACDLSGRSGFVNSQAMD